MNPEMSSECVEIVTAAVDKYLVAENYEKASQVCKESLEKKFGPTWNVCVGEGFGYDVTFNAKHCLLVYYGEWRRGHCCLVIPSFFPFSHHTKNNPLSFFWRRREAGDIDIQDVIDRGCNQ